jgi:cyclic beta-1,2-glucan synthetase
VDGIRLAAVIVPERCPSWRDCSRGGRISRRSLRAVGATSRRRRHVRPGAAYLAHQVADGRRDRANLTRHTARTESLEWTTAAQSKASGDLGLAGFYRQMAGAVAIAAATAILVFVVKPGAGWIAAPLSACGCSPLIARRVSLPPPSRLRTAVGRRRGDARLTARRTCASKPSWVRDHGLPPDNFQDDPRPIVAHRTSPTNIGMYLLATVTARDFGWIGTLEMVERLEATLATIGSLERFRGHLYNWYDTRDLHQLEPAYVSSVDSGNLAGHLLALSNACRQMIDQPLPVATALAGIGDGIALAREAAGAIGDDRRSQR